MKNNYPLLLISDIIKNIRTKKVLIKLDLRWEYNNVSIKKENEWKVAFTTSEVLFEPTVMFFGLKNSPATFQTIINKLLRDLINTGKVGSFICKTREMWMESKRGKLFRSSNWTGGNININIRRKSKSSVRLASSEIGQ